MAQSVHLYNQGAAAAASKYLEHQYTVHPLSAQPPLCCPQTHRGLCLMWPVLVGDKSHLTGRRRRTADVKLTSGRSADPLGLKGPNSVL